MKILSKEKIKVLAEINDWSLVYAEGYLDGEISRRRRKVPSTHAQIGIDEYCLGFRAGYYERQHIVRPGFDLRAHSQMAPLARPSLLRSNDSGEVAVSTVVALSS